MKKIIKYITREREYNSKYLTLLTGDHILFGIAIGSGEDIDEKDSYFGLIIVIPVIAITLKCPRFKK